MGLSSLFEQLPTELLQDIFLFSANLHLPLCSRQLLSALTSDHLKYEITLQILVYQSHKLGDDDRSLLLSRRFFTWDFVVRYVRFAHSRVAIATDQESSSPENSDDEVEEDGNDGVADRSSRRGSMGRKTPSVPAPELREIDCHLTMLSRNAIEELRRDEIGHLIEMDTIPSPALDEIRQNTSLGGLQGLEIPERLLHNGWDDDRLRLLRLLIAFNCTVSRSSPAGAAAEEGIEEAIGQGDEEMVSHFLGAHIGVETALEMLRKAMTGNNVSIVFQLLLSSRKQLDRLDPQVWKLLESHLRWEKGTKATVRKWLQKGIPQSISETHAQYLPRLRDVDEHINRWTPASVASC
jgi:hypothetical protein